MRPSAGCEIIDVLVDGIQLPPLYSYTFSDVQDDHTLHVNFAAKQLTLRGTCGLGGDIEPSETETCSPGGEVTYSFTPDQGTGASHTCVHAP